MKSEWKDKQMCNGCKHSTIHNETSANEFGLLGDCWESTKISFDYRGDNMSVNPVVLSIKPNDIDKNWVLSDSVYYYSDDTDDDNCAKVICEPYDSVQRDSIYVWQTKCLCRDFPKEKVKKLNRALQYQEIVFPVTLDNIKLFKEMLDVNWRRSEFYNTREAFYHTHPLNEEFYVKVRLALRAGKTLVIQWV